MSIARALGLLHASWTICSPLQGEACCQCGGNLGGGSTGSPSSCSIAEPTPCLTGAGCAIVEGACETSVTYRYGEMCAVLTPTPAIPAEPSVRFSSVITSKGWDFYVDITVSPWPNVVHASIEFGIFTNPYPFFKGCSAGVTTST